MTRVGDHMAQGCVVKAVLLRAVEQIEQRQVFGDAKGADRVPHADKMDRCGLFCRLAVCCIVEWIAFRIGERFAGAIGGKHLAYALPHLVRRRGHGQIDKPAIGDQPAEAAYRVGAAAETEKKNLVADLIVRTEPAIGTHNVLIESVAGAAAGDTVPPAFSRADSRVVVRKLL